MTPDRSALIERPCAATDQADLRDRIMNPNAAKSEAEWWASREIERLESILRDLTEWRDIATAPKDGTNILVYEDGATTVVFWDDDHESWLHPYKGGKTRWPNVTHWLPLPSAPNQAKEAGE